MPFEGASCPQYDDAFARFRGATVQPERLPFFRMGRRGDECEPWECSKFVHLFGTIAHVMRTNACVGMLVCEHSSAADGSSLTEDPKQLPYICIEGRTMELWNGILKGTLRDERRAREAAGVRTQAACPCHNTRAAIARALASVSQAFLRA